MKIAYVRGAFLNPFEMQLYRPLASRHDIVAVGADWQFYTLPLAIDPIRVHRAALSASHAQVLGSWGPVAINRLLSWTTGISYRLSDLESHVGNPQILHAAETFFTMSYQSLVLKRKNGCKLVVTVSENLPHRGERHPLRRRRKMAVQNEADLFIAITPNTQRMLIGDGVPAEKIKVVPNSVDMRVFSPGPKPLDLVQKYGLTDRDFVVLFIGRLIEEKGVTELLQAHRLLVKSDPAIRWRFFFVGAGPLQSSIEKAQREFPGGILWHPFVPYEEIYRWHRLADVFVLPSKPSFNVAEQFGYVLAESMACEKPVISTRVGSIPDVVGDAGMLVPPGDSRALADAIGAMARSSERSRDYAKRGIDRCRALFNAETNARQLEIYYQDLLRS